MTWWSLGSAGLSSVVGAVQQAEMSQNVQQYSKDVYLRASEAQQCQIQSTIVLPLFDSHERKASVGVLEVVQTAKDMPFAYVISTLNEILMVYPFSHVDRRSPP